MGAGPIAGHLERPSQEAPETRKAKKQKANVITRRRVQNAFAAVLDGELALVLAQQKAERHRALAAVLSALNERHASGSAAVISHYAARRVAIESMTDPTARAAALVHLASEQTAEIHALTLAHAAEVRSKRTEVLAQILPQHRDVRRAIRQRNRRLKDVTRVMTKPAIEANQSWQPVQQKSKAGRRRPHRFQSRNLHRLSS